MKPSKLQIFLKIFKFNNKILFKKNLVSTKLTHIDTNLSLTSAKKWNANFMCFMKVSFYE